MGIEEVIITPRSPWQNPYVERLIGSIRRELLDHVIVLNELHLRYPVNGIHGLLPPVSHAFVARHGLPRAAPHLLA